MTSHRMGRLHCLPTHSSPMDTWVVQASEFLKLPGVPEVQVWWRASGHGKPLAPWRARRSWLSCQWWSPLLSSPNRAAGSSLPQQTPLQGLLPRWYHPLHLSAPPGGADPLRVAPPTPGRARGSHARLLGGLQPHTHRSPAGAPFLHL